MVMARIPEHAAKPLVEIEWLLMMDRYRLAAHPKALAADMARISRMTMREAIESLQFKPKENP